MNNLDNLPDVRDGLNRTERVVLYCIHELQKERNGRNVPTAMLYGRVLEHVDMSESELQEILQRLTGSA
jgi:DNA gyrase/topoisomerase IV subunit A